MDKTKSHTRITKLDRTNKYLLFAPLSLFGLTVLSGTILMSNSVNADNDSVVDEINITVPVSCTLSGVGMNTHNATINNGQYNSAIGETTIKAFCNDNNGFAIYAIGYTDDTDGNNVLTSSTLGSTYDIVTGTATGPVNNVDTSQWAMKLSTVTNPASTYSIIIAGSTADTDKEQGDPDYSSFQEVPDDYALVAKRTAGTDVGANAEGATLKTTYQAYISKTQPAGTYTGQVKYTLVHPSTATAPQKPISIETAMANANKQKLNGYYKMQDLDNTICSTVNVIEGDGMTELIDVRDNHVYKVTKLKDNRCWLLENLALDPTDPTTAANMSADNTNASAAAIYNYLNGGNPDSITGWSSIAVADADTGFDSYIAPMINNASKNTLVTSYGPASENGQAKVGVYYNYCSASVSTYCYEENQGTDKPSTTIDTDEDICPTNWRMPTGGNTGEYYILSQNYGSNATATDSLQYNLSAPLSGYFGNSSAILQDSLGFFWTSTFDDGRTMSVLVFDSSGVYFSGASRVIGQSIRCLVSD